jgi:hypothetical protein
MAVQPAERGVEAPPLTLSIFEFNSKVMQDELQKLALKVNHHEENIRFLKSELNAVEDSCADLGSEILMPCDTLLLYILLIYGFVVIFVYSSNAIYRYHDAE